MTTDTAADLYGSSDGVAFSAPVIRIDDKGHGITRGVVYRAEARQQTDFESELPLWWRKGSHRPVPSAEPRDGDRPCNEFVFHVAVKEGKGAFTRRDADGEAVKLDSGKNALDVRDLKDEDVAIVAGSAWLSRAVKSVKLFTGHEFRLVRTTPARDENGDRMTKVDCEIEILGKVDNPQPFKADTSDAADVYGEAEGSEMPF